jgi:hypothetical protein
MGGAESGTPRDSELGAEGSSSVCVSPTLRSRVPKNT